MAEMSSEVSESDSIDLLYPQFDGLLREYQQLDEPTAVTHGVFIAYETYYQSIYEPDAAVAPTATLYFDEIWSGQWTNSDPLVPNYCDNNEASANEFNYPRTNSPPYPSTTITGIPLAGTNPKPTCNWIPGQSNEGPGHLTCDLSPTSVSCAVANAGPTNCYAETTEVTPVIQCIWLANE